MKIDGRDIGPAHRPYIIAEMSANHNGCLDAALRLIEVAKVSGADAVKLQTYRPDTITMRSDRPEFRIDDGPWAGRSLYELYEWAHTPWEWHEALFERARQLGITIFSSPFDRTAVDLLEGLGAPAYKIASFELIDHDLIGYVAQTGKPMIMSTGMANLEEIMEAITCARDHGARELAVLHCVSGYPAPAADYNLRTLVDMGRRFDVVTGLSDHTLDNTTAICAVALGASLIEKHFTLDRAGGGADDAFSLEPAGLVELCRGSRTAWAAMGQVDYGRKSSELGNVKFRRSLYFTRDMKAGEVIRRGDVRSVRPGYGLPPKMLSQVIDSVLQRDVEACSPVGADDYVSAS